MRILPAVCVLAAACNVQPRYDIVLRGGTIYDGSGNPPVTGDVGIRGDSIAAMGTVQGRGRVEIQVDGLAVAPGFINMLSWAGEDLIADGRSQSDIRQGVTLEIMGEGRSLGPLTDSMKANVIRRQGDIKYDIPWTTLGEGMEYLASRGIAPNIGSFVGATTVRINVLGYDDRAPSTSELGQMQELVRQAMEDGGLGVSSALIYTPATFAQTDELIGLAKAAAPYGGIYISHIRNESGELLSAVEELIRISREAGIAAEIYHFKAAGKDNWRLADSAMALVEEARAEGLRITADMYTYPASSTGLDVTMPPWVQEGGHDAWVRRLRDPAVRRRVAREMVTPTRLWDNGYVSAGTPDNILLVGFKSDSLKYLTGKTLAQVAALRHASPVETAMELVIQDDSRVECVFFEMSEENLRKQIRQPWMSFGSDGGSMAPEGVFLRTSTHPRAYGNFARLLGKYVREENLLTLHEAIRRLTTLPATNLSLRRRGALKPGYYADLVVFDPGRITDNATFEQPHQFATGMVHVFVNGVQVLKDGEHTGATPGRVVRGPGYRDGRRR